MRTPIVLSLSLTLTACGLLHANEALDLLEGKRRAGDAALTSTTTESTTKTDGSVDTERTWPASPLDAVWSRAVVYEQEENPWVQRIAITGFFDAQASFGNAEVDGVGAVEGEKVDLDGTRTRRARLGARLRAFRNTDIEATAEFAGEGSYRGIERLSARTSVLPETFITYGKFRPGFGASYPGTPGFSGYPDRSALSNLLGPASALGVRVDHTWRGWDYGLSWFSSDADSYLPNLQGDGLLGLHLGRTVIEKSGASLARVRWHMDYLHNFDPVDSDILPRFDVGGRRSANGGQLAVNPAYRHLLATGFTLEQDRLTFLGDFMVGRGEASVYGLTLEPAYWLVPGWLKIVGRYHYADTSDAGGIVTSFGTSSDLQFDDSPFFVGDEVTSLYLGANFHAYQDRLILMAGLEHIELDDEDGAGFNTEAWIWHTGARFSF